MLAFPKNMTMFTLPSISTDIAQSWPRLVSPAQFY